MISWVLGAAIGVLLAFANFCASAALSSMAMRSSKALSIGIVLGSFFGRLFLLFLAFYLLSRVEIIHLPYTLVTFLVCFTVLIFWEVRIYYRKSRFTKEAAPPGVRAR